MTKPRKLRINYSSCCSSGCVEVANRKSKINFLAIKLNYLLPYWKQRSKNSCNALFDKVDKSKELINKHELLKLAIRIEI
nr:unnamed protein product [Callosobruchus chinensis]